MKIRKVLVIVICMFVVMHNSVCAKTLREALDENLWIYAPENVKNEVFIYAQSDVDREMYKNCRYEYTRAGWFATNGSGLFLDKEKAYKLYQISRNAFSVAQDYLKLYDYLHYARNNELELLFTNGLEWEAPVMSNEKYITSMFGTLDQTGVYSTYGRENSYFWKYDQATTNTQELINAIFSITEIEGLTDIECTKIVRHSPVTYIYIKSGGKEYALPFSTGTDRIWIPNTLFSLKFEFEEGKLYTAAEMYETIIEQYFALLDKIIGLYEEDAVYNGVKLYSENIPEIRRMNQEPNGKIMATPGEMAEKLQSAGLLKGSDNGLEIHKDLTRAEGITMLLRMTGEEEIAGGEDLQTVFTDVDSTHWANKNITYAYNKGLVKGTSETTFSPEEKLSAAQFMVMLLRAMGYDSVDGETLSLGNANELAKKVGLETNFFDVQELKRGQMAAIASRALNVVGSDGKTISEKLFESGEITKAQYDSITSPDFYTVSFED